jgi:mannose-6-phosphate isomerase-like protein (cupin superfamily)
VSAPVPPAPRGRSGPVVRRLVDADCWRIAVGDTTRLAALAEPTPDGGGCSVFFEIWDPGGSQPPNSHPDSDEVFTFLAGAGVAHCDGHQVAIGAGDTLVLRAGSVHRIENTGPDRMYAVVTMVQDHGFAAFVRRGVPAPLDAEDLAVLHAHLPA